MANSDLIYISSFSHYDSEAMKNLSSLIELMGNASTAAISMGKVKGLLSRLHKEDPKDINFGFSPNKDMSVSTVTLITNSPLTYYESNCFILKLNTENCTQTDED